jgi:hypothetical protein
MTLATRGLAEAAVGDHDRGRKSVRAALLQLEAINDSAGTPGVMVNLAAVELMAGETHAARVIADNAVELARPQGFGRLDALTRTFAAQLADREGDHVAARRHAGEAGRLFADFGCRPGEERVATLLATTAKAR